MMEEPWIEKYRPRFVRDIVGNEEAVGRLDVISRDGNLPNIIISARSVPERRKLVRWSLPFLCALIV